MMKSKNTKCLFLYPASFHKTTWEKFGHRTQKSYLSKKCTEKENVLEQKEPFPNQMKYIRSEKKPTDTEKKPTDTVLYWAKTPHRD